MNKKRLFTVILILLTVFLLLGILEVYFRWVNPYLASTYVNVSGRIYPLSGLARQEHYTFDPLTGYSLIPGMHDEKQLITTDEYGFRVTSRKIDPAKESIVFVGDSTVFGWGVGDEDSFCYLLSKENSLAGYNIINMGVPSYSLSHIVSVMRNKVPEFRPRIVFVGILWPWKPFEAYANDGWKRIDFDFYRRTIPLRDKFSGPARASWKRFIPATFFMFRDMYYRLKYREQVAENMTRPGIRDFSLSAEEEKDLALEHVVLLKTAAKPLQEQGARVVFYIHPYQYTVFHPRYLHLGESGRNLIIRDLNAFYPGDFLKENFHGRPLYIDGSHLAPEGHAVLERYFLKIIAEQR